MAGVKGKSGRKSWEEEAKRTEVLQLSYQVLKYALTNDKVPLLRKIDIAKTLISKRIPTESKVEMEATVNQPEAFQEALKRSRGLIEPSEN